MVIPLSKIEVGHEAEIVWIASEDSMACQLNQLGFRPGSRVRFVLQESKEGLRAYLINHALVALRDSTAHEILVRQVVQSD